MTTFPGLFGRPPTVAAEAPGWVHLIGEHTDYNGGYVLSTAIPQRPRVERAPRADRRIGVWGANVPGSARPAAYGSGTEERRHNWVDYVQGVSAGPAGGDVLQRRFDARIASNVPHGNGLASSAALESTVLRARRAAFGLPLDDVELARLGQRAENEFAGARVGIMDQIAASLTDLHTAVFLDSRSLRLERVPLPATAALAVIDSAPRTADASGSPSAGPVRLLCRGHARAGPRAAAGLRTRSLLKSPAAGARQQFFRPTDTLLPSVA